jgi:hypothetical protein
MTGVRPRPLAYGYSLVFKTYSQHREGTLAARLLGAAEKAMDDAREQVLAKLGLEFARDGNVIGVAHVRKVGEPVSLCGRQMTSRTTPKGECRRCNGIVLDITGVWVLGEHG